MTSRAHAVKPYVDVCDDSAYIFSPGMCCSTTADHMGSLVATSRTRLSMATRRSTAASGAAARNLSPTPTPVAKVVRPPPMVKVVQPPMKKARAEEHPAEEYSQEEMGKWEAWADEAVRRANKNAETDKLAEGAVAPTRHKIRQLVITKRI